MEDIAQELLKSVEEKFKDEFNSNSEIAALYAKIRDGTATYKEANQFAVKTGEILANAYKSNISSSVLPDGRMYYNIAQKIITPTFTNNYDLISDVTQQIQTILNKSAGIGIKAIKPDLDTENIESIINKISISDKYDDVSWILDEPVVNFSQSIVDNSIRNNAIFHAKSGIKAKIVRKTSGKCCEWCANLAGTYVYPDVPDDVYHRHNNCRCTVDYNTGDGRSQNVWSKSWKEETKIREVSNAETKKLTPRERMRNIPTMEKLSPEERVKLASEIEKNTESGIIKLSNEAVRKKYIEKVSKIKDNIVQDLPMEIKAKMAFDARNQIRTEARNMMADEDTRKKLEIERPNKTFEELIISKMQRKGMTREEAIIDIYETSTKTNENVNRELGIRGD